MKNLREHTMELKLAWRNVWKNRRRSILTLLTVMAGCAMIIFFRAMQDGGYEQMIEDAVSANTAHIQIHEKGYWENPSIQYALMPEDRIMETLDKNEKIRAFSRRVIAGALLSIEDKTRGIKVKAVDPAREKKITTLHENILKGGRYLEPGDTTEAVMGHTLAKNLGVHEGDTIAMISQGFDGSIAAENLTIVGRFRTGNPEYDRAMVVMPLSRAMKTFTMMGYVTAIAVRLQETTQMEEVRSALRGSLDTEKLEIMGWDELQPELVQFITMDRVSGYIFYVVLFMIVAFGVLNTIQMSVFERTRELGVMLAIGTRPSQVLAMVIFESAMISFIGVVMGVILGSAISYYFALNPIDYSGFAREMEVWGVSTYVFPAKLQSASVVTTAVATFLLGVLFSIAPARRASKLRPVEAIQKL